MSTPFDATTPARAETFAIPTTTSAETKAESSSLGEIIADIGEDLSTLLRQEVELAKAEVKESAQKAGRGAGMFGGAATAGWFALLFLSLAVWEWLSGAIDNRGWAAVIVMAVWAVVAAVLAAAGRSSFRKIDGLPRTVDTSKKIPDALKGHEETR
ncbi:phage holin family protein [Intrasporangium sp. YIM S08009]|uniref:phage holin family protein n=1 Tax=Intrasporangium zincisolvens TaxID=3080018 RepID=UPI002B0523AA|nr:phage holin family protein [Intrasporangium sp. YIM S08009]